MIKFPQVHVKLTGEDGNVFSIIGRVTKAMREAGIEKAKIDAWRDQAFGCGSYDEVLQLVMRTVEVS